MGLVFLFAILLYLTVLIAIPILSYRYAAGIGWSPRKRKWAAVVGFLILFLPVFWDSLPTAWAFSYYCDNYAGLTVNKTLDQWKAENPGVSQSLVRQSPPLQVGSGDNYYFQLNQRLRWERRNSAKLLTIVQQEQSVVDSQTGEVLVRFVDFGTKHSIRSVENLRDVKIWLNWNSCGPEGGTPEGRDFSRLLASFENLGAAK